MSYYIGVTKPIEDIQIFSKKLFNLITEAVSFKESYQDEDLDDTIYVVLSSRNKKLNRFLINSDLVDKYKFVYIYNFNDYDRDVSAKSDFEVFSKSEEEEQDNFYKNIDILVAVGDLMGEVRSTNFTNIKIIS